MDFVTKHAKNKKDNSSIIFKSVIAKEAKTKDKSVINATIGMLYDENEEFYTFKSVKDVDLSLNNEQKFPYTNSVGIKPFCDAVAKWVFGSYYDYFKEQENLEVIATPGGSGAISNAFSNYLNPGEKVLLPDPMWTNYTQMAYENHLGYTTYKMFDDNGNFNLQDVKESIINLQKEQDRIIFVINDPCHNPTGFCLERNEWQELINIINKLASKEHPIILFYDMAYIDYDKRGQEFTRQTISDFRLLNQNVLTILGFSGSKTLGLYGIRIGAMLGITKDKKASLEFLDSCQYSARAKYSMCSTYGMYLIAKVLGEEPYLTNFKNEIKEVSAFIKERSEIFINECKNVNLKTEPFKCGFFVTIPCQNDEAVYDYLVTKKVHVAPVGNAIRVAICSISKEHCKLLPKLIKEALLKA